MPKPAFKRFVFEVAGFAVPVSYRSIDGAPDGHFVLLAVQAAAIRASGGEFCLDQPAIGKLTYLVAMPGPRPSGTGTVKITSYAAAAGDCNLAQWIGTSNAELFYVDCYSSAGRLQNTPFGIVYARNNNLMGQNGLTDANAFASRPRAGRYQPHLQFDSHRGARVTAVRVRTGIYDVFFAGSQGPASDPNGGGGVQVTAAGRTDTHCAIADWLQASKPFAEVVCQNNSGHLVNSKFTIQWVVA